MTNPGDTGGVAGALTRLAERSASLSRLDDEYLKLINRTEEALRALNLGFFVDTWISSSQADESGASFVRCLAFEKIGGAWRLVERSGLDQDDPDDWSSVPLASCDRELRFSVFADGHVEKLLLKALEVLDAAVAKRELHLAPSTALVVAIEHARPARPTKGGKP